MGKRLYKRMGLVKVNVVRVTTRVNHRTEYDNIMKLETNCHHFSMQYNWTWVDKGIELRCAVCKVLIKTGINVKEMLDKLEAELEEEAYIYGS